jgi:hypothetical protein
MGRFLFHASFCFFLLAAVAIVTVGNSTAEELPEPGSLSTGVSTGPARNPFSGGRKAVFADMNLELGLDAGLRFDRLLWSIAGNSAGQSPNILSELKWSDVESHQLTLSGRARWGPHFYGRGHVSFAWIDSGRVRDSDYRGDNRTQEYSRSICQTNGDHLWDIVAGIGYPFAFFNRQLLWAPMTGFSIHRQFFRITNGQQIISENLLDIGPIDSRLNSSYKAMWRNWWLGFDLRYDHASFLKPLLPMAWELSLKYYALADYSAEADWNLRNDLAHPVSFEHDAQGDGFSAQLLWLIPLSRRIDMNFNINYIRLKTDPGKDKVYLSDGRRLITRLNEVVWESNSVMLGIAWRF